jgi:hypothetical protein
MKAYKWKLLALVAIIGIILGLTLSQQFDKLTFESMAVQNVKSAMKYFRTGDVIRYPTNWTEVSTFADLRKLNELAFIKGEIFPLERYYVFIPADVEIAVPPNFRVLLIRTSAMREKGHRSLGRYAICQNTDGLSFRWLDESVVEKALAQVGGKLPEPDWKWVEAMETTVKNHEKRPK